MSDKIERKIGEINKSILLNNTTFKSQALYTGNGGKLLLQSIQKPFVNQVFVTCDEIINGISTETTPALTFCGGVSGTLWLFSYLKRKKLIELETDFFDHLDSVISEIAQYKISHRNYDFLHGAGGMLFYLLERPEKNKEQLMILARELLRMRIRYKGFKIWQYLSFDPEHKNQFQINLGLAHGLPSMLVLLSKFYKNGISREDCKDAIKELYLFFKSVKRTTSRSQFSFYPPLIRDGEELLYNGRLAWCYGDLGIAIAFFVAGREIGSDEMVQEALEIFAHHSKNRNQDKTGVKDSSFCHGAAGVMFLFNRIYQHTNDNLFRDSTEYWLDVLLKMGTHVDGLAGYKYFTTEGWVNEPNLLEGATGIAAVLISYMHPDSIGWDQCFLTS